MAVWIAEFAAFLVLWLLFAASLATPEILVGAAAAWIAVAAMEALKRAEPLQFRPPWRALIAAWRLPGLIVQGHWILATVLARRIAGKRKQARFELITFRAIADDSVSAAKRALAILYLTVPPNSLVIGIDRKTRKMLFHQVRKTPPPEILRRLETA